MAISPRLARAVLLACAVAVLPSSRSFAGQARRAGADPAPRARKALLALERRIDRVWERRGGGFSAALARATFDVQGLERDVAAAAAAAPEACRAHALALLAKLTRVCRRRPGVALGFVAASLIEAERLQEWQEQDLEAREAALAQWRRRCRQARAERTDAPPKPTDELAIPFPPASTWRIDERNWTITQDRAAFTAGNISWYVHDEQVIREGLAILRAAASSGRANPYVHRARLVLGVRLMKLGRIREGAAWLARVPKSASGYFSVAQEYLGALEEAVRDAKTRMKTRPKTKTPRLDKKRTGPSNKGANAGGRS